MMGMKKPMPMQSNKGGALRGADRAAMAKGMGKGQMPAGYANGGKVGKSKGAPFMKGKKMANGGMAKGKKGC